MPKRLWIVLPLLLICVVSAFALLRASGDQVYFEPTDDALQTARAAHHAAVVWALVLIAVGFVTAVTAQRLSLLANPIVAAMSFMIGNLFAIWLACVAVVVVDLIVVAVELIGRPGQADRP